MVYGLRDISLKKIFKFSIEIQGCTGLSDTLILPDIKLIYPDIEFHWILDNSGLTTVGEVWCQGAGALCADE